MTHAIKNEMYAANFADGIVVFAKKNGLARDSDVRQVLDFIIEHRLTTNAVIAFSGGGALNPRQRQWSVDALASIPKGGRFALLTPASEALGSATAMQWRAQGRMVLVEAFGSDVEAALAFIKAGDRGTRIRSRLRELIIMVQGDPDGCVLNRL